MKKSAAASALLAGDDTPLDPLTQRPTGDDGARCWIPGIMNSEAEARGRPTGLRVDERDLLINPARELIDVTSIMDLISL